MPSMELEILSLSPNEAIVRTPGRKFPGMVIQGDTLHSLCALARELRSAVEKRQGSEVEDETVKLAKELEERLTAKLNVYEKVLTGLNLPLPFE